MSARIPSPDGRIRQLAKSSALGLLLLVTAFPAFGWRSTLGLEEQKVKVAWGYEGEIGPEHWGDLAPEYAACKGNRQSPVDLSGGQRVRYSPLYFRYRSNPLTLVHKEPSIRVETPLGSYLVDGGHRYQLTGFQFHVPGEHRIEGRVANMELQLEHRDYQGRIAMVAVPMEVGRRRYSILARIWDHMLGMQGQRFHGRQIGINPRFLLPGDLSYYSYVGSLTEPPCTEGVEWFVLAGPIEVDRRYLHRYFRTTGRNARPLQPLDGRPVLVSLRR